MMYKYKKPRYFQDGGNTTQKPSEGSQGSSVGSYIGLATSLLPGIADLFTETQAEKNITKAGDEMVEDTQDLANTKFRGSNASLLEQSKYLPVWQDVTMDDFGGEANEGGAFLAGAAQGASAGAMTGNPWVAAGAAIVGGLTGYFNTEDDNRRKHR